MTASQRADTAAQLLRDYGTSIAHMRERVAAGRFGLVLGAGVSKNLGFPSWEELLQRIAAHPAVGATDLVAAADGKLTRSQLLFEHFRQRTRSSMDKLDSLLDPEDGVKIEWQKVVHHCLYSPVDGQAQTFEVSDLKGRDRYLNEFLGVIRQCPITINYNFDDSLQRLLLAAREPEARTRGHSTVWSSNVQFPAGSGVIYHPNGYLPFELKEQPSDNLVFLEDAFADQLIDSVAGGYTSLSHHLAQTTCLLMGLSLEDPTLRHVLRQTAISHPGHVHYYVRYIAADESPGKDRLRAEVESNWGIYNLITLSLDDDRYSALGWLLSLDDANYRNFVRDCGAPENYTFYLTGPVGVGKTTALSRLRSLRTHEEWPDPLYPKMIVDPKTLNSADLREIDDWVNQQLFKKNEAVYDPGPGIDVIDRAPLDAFAFVPREIWQERAASLQTAVRGPFPPNHNLVPGHVILMDGDTRAIEARARKVYRDPTLDGIQRQQTILREVYSKHDGVSIVDTAGRTPAAVARLVAEIIHRRRYTPFPLHERLIELGQESAGS